jgi:aspartokinase/homoserine dehydrogenase 1
MKVLKFGGSSVGTPDRIKGVKEIILKNNSPCVVVVSAFQGITDDLKKTCELASLHDEAYKILFEKIHIKHIDYAKQLVKGKKLDDLTAKLNMVCDSLLETLNGIYLLRELSKHSLDQSLATGEILSSLIISTYIDGSRYSDSRSFIKTDSNFGSANVDFILTNTLINEIINREEKCTIVPGYIASNLSGETTTLGRGGSDYSAAIIAAATKAEVLEIWTDVDGFMSADPKNVEKAYAIENLTYSEAIELSHFGAKVIYTPTLRPVYKKNIPVLVLNTFKPELKGTLISHKPSDNKKSPIKGISSIDHIDLITLQGAGMVGVTGTSMRLFTALAGKNINIILITRQTQCWQRKQFMMSSKRK